MSSDHFRAFSAVLLVFALVMVAWLGRYSMSNSNMLVLDRWTGEACAPGASAGDPPICYRVHR